MTSPSQLRRGEILGIAGLIGAGRSEIVKGICGSTRAQRRGDPRRQAASPSAATATASTTASSTCRRTARATASSSTCRSRPMSSAIDLPRSRPRGAPSTTRRRPSRPNRLGDRLGAQARRHQRPRLVALGRQPAEGRHRQDAVGQSARSSSSTSRPAASMSAPRPRSTASCATWRANGVGIVVVSPSCRS